MKNTVGKENRKLYWVVAIFAFLGLSLVCVSFVGNTVQIGIRGYISGGAEWTKAQKVSTFALFRYINSGDESYYEKFKEPLSVLYGNRMAREAISLNKIDMEQAKDGLLMGNNHPDDVGAMIWVYFNFKNHRQIQYAGQIWEQGDNRIEDLVRLANTIHQKASVRQLSRSEIREFNNELAALDYELTKLEEEFSNAMSSVGRWVGQVFFWSTSILSTLLIVIAAFTAVSYMRSFREANIRLKESEQKFKNVLDHSRDVIYQIAIGAEQYEYMSSSVKDMLGYKAEAIMAGGPTFILERTHPEDISRLKKKIEQLESENLEENLSEDTEFRVKRSDGRYIWVNNKRSLLRDEDGTPVAIVGNVRDITVHKYQVEKLDKSLIEKQTLLAEIHHRVKNNLAIVSSLIELQKDEVDDRILRSSFHDIQSRIKSIALIHEKLYENTIFSEVELSSYLKELAGMISDTYRSRQKKVEISFDLEDVKLDMTTAVPIGLICNELINNCFKHAFNNSSRGEVNIRLRDEGEFVSVEVSDNGIGLPDDFDLNNVNSLGVTLLNVLTQQVRGQMSVQSGQNTSFKLLFPKAIENGKLEMQSV